MNTSYKNRPVYIEVANLSSDPVDAYASSGYYLDTSTDLSEEELDAIGMETDFSFECLEYQIGRAEDLVSER